MEAGGGDIDGHWAFLVFDDELVGVADRADEADTGRGRGPTRSAPVDDLRRAVKDAGSNSGERGITGRSGNVSGGVGSEEAAIAGGGLDGGDEIHLDEGDDGTALFMSSSEPLRGDASGVGSDAVTPFDNNDRTAGAMRCVDSVSWAEAIGEGSPKGTRLVSVPCAGTSFPTKAGTDVDGRRGSPRSSMAATSRFLVPSA